MAAFSVSHDGHTSTRNLSLADAGIAWQAANDTLTLLGYEIARMELGHEASYTYRHTDTGLEVTIVMPMVPLPAQGSRVMNDAEYKAWKKRGK